MKKFTINTKRTYTKNGEEKAFWSKVGELKVNDDGKQFIELFMFPSTSFYVFEDTPKTEATSSQPVEESAPSVRPAGYQGDLNGEVDTSDIPF